MQLPLTIGQSSSNEAFLVDLAFLPHLFISFTNAELLNEIMSSFCSQLISSGEKKEVQFAIALNKSNADTLIP